MLILRNFKPAFGLISASPFGIKAIALMKLSGLEFENREGNMRKSPTGKLPLLQDDQKLVPDSTLMQYYLEDTYNVNFNDGMSDEQIAVARAFQSMCEEHLYWTGMYFRWIENPDAVRKEFFGTVPALIRPIIFNMVLRGVRKKQIAHGMGLHDRATILRFAENMIKSVSDFLGDKPYFMGDKPFGIDATIFGFISTVVDGDTKSPLSEIAAKYPNLKRYTNHFHKTVIEA